MRMGACNTEFSMLCGSVSDDPQIMFDETWRESLRDSLSTMKETSKEGLAMKTIPRFASAKKYELTPIFRAPDKGGNAYLCPAQTARRFVYAAVCTTRAQYAAS